MGTKEEQNKLMDKLRVAESKAKKYVQLEADFKRKQKALQEKCKLID